MKEEKPAEVKAEQAKPAVQAVAVQSGDMQKVSPRARMTADKKGVSIQGLAGSGPEGRIIERDVLAAAESGAKITPAARERMEAEKLAAPGAGSGLGGTVITSYSIHYTKLYDPAPRPWRRTAPSTPSPGRPPAVPPP